MGSLFFGADFHFNDQDIMKFNTRPWKTMDEMNEGLIKNWNELVKDEDTVVVIGDFIYADHERILGKLKGEIILIVGNHDQINRMSNRAMNRFKDIRHLKIITYGTKEFVCCHYAMRIWENSHYGSIQLFGHSHGRMKTSNLSFDMGVDLPENKFAPVSAEEVIKRAEIRKVEMQLDNRMYDGSYDKTIIYTDDLAWLAKEVQHGKVKSADRFVCAK